MMKIVFQDFGEYSLDTFARGETRWAINWIYFLKKLGHDVEVIPITASPDFDLCFSWDTCEHIVDRPHVHNHFSPRNNSLLEILPCYQKHGAAMISNPYRAGYEEALPWAAEHNITQAFMPMCYPDGLLPGDLRPGFERTEITWATKDCFHPNYCSLKSSEYHIPQSAINTLKGIRKLSKKADFKTNLLMDYYTNTPGADMFGAQELISQIPNLERKGNVSWTELVQIMGRSKLNVPVGGLSGSCLESIFSESLPMFYSNISFFPTTQEITLLPPAQEVTEQDIYDALEAFWFDEVAYTRAWEHYQDAFVDHRTNKLIQHFNETLEKSIERGNR